MNGPSASERAPFGVLIDRSGDRVLLALSGELGVDSGRRFEEAVAEVGRERVGQLIVDIGGISFIDTTGAFLLLELFNRFKTDARVTFEGGSPQVQRMFETAGLGGVLPGTAPSPASHGAPDDDWTVSHGHQRHSHSYIGLPRRDMPPRQRP